MGNQLTSIFQFDFALLRFLLFWTLGTVNRDNILTYLIAGFLAIVFRLLIPGRCITPQVFAFAAGIGAG